VDQFYGRHVGQGCGLQSKYRISSQQLPQQLVLFDWKSVCGRKREYVMVGVEEPSGHAEESGRAGTILHSFNSRSNIDPNKFGARRYFQATSWTGRE
jgi:hypothetical protein